MSTKSDIENLIVGEAIKTICKLRVNESFAREDIKVSQSRRVQLIDSNNRSKH